MEIGKINYQTWINILKSEQNLAIEFLALQILLFRIKNALKNDPSSEVRCVGELKKFFETNQKIPAAMKELEKLIRLEVNQ